MEATEIRSARPMPEMILRITETGREITDTPEAPANRVDLADIRAWRFFRASPAEFLEQYGRDFCIDHIHAAFEVLTEAVKHLDLWHTRSLTLSGHIGSRRLTALRKTCDQRGIRLTVTYLTAPRALTFDTADASLRHAGSCGTALLTAGIGSDSPLRATPSVYWSAWFHRFFYDEVLPVLRVRDPGTFFSYLKVLSDYIRPRHELGRNRHALRDFRALRARLVPVSCGLRCGGTRRSCLRSGTAPRQDAPETFLEYAGPCGLVFRYGRAPYAGTQKCTH